MNYLSDSSLESDYEIDNRLNDPRVFRERPNYKEVLNNQEFLRRFRVSKNSFQELLDKIKNVIQPATLR